MTNARIMTVSVLFFEEQETLGRNMKISVSPTSCINAHAKKSNKTSSNMIGLVSERKNILRSFLRSWNEIGGPRCEPARWIKFCAVIGYQSGQDGARVYPLCVTLAAHFNNKRCSSALKNCLDWEYKRPRITKLAHEASPKNPKHVRGCHVTTRNETNRKWQCRIEMVVTLCPARKISPKAIW